MCAAMLDFRDVAAEEQIRSFSQYFEAVDYPSRPLSAEAKTFFASFFGGNGLVTFCDLLFGPYYDKYRVEDDEMCWMDYANAAPTKSLAVTLLGMVHPSSTFVSTLEALSTPSATFSSRLTTGWKNSSEARLTSVYSLDLPLSAVHPQFFQLMGEAGETNLYTLPRSRCPPMLLVPYWDPPLVTRKEVSQQQVMTSLPCTPMGYFLLRLLLFGMRRMQRHGVDYVAARKAGNIVQWMCRARDVVYTTFYRGIPADMPFYAQLLQSYIQIYVSATLPRHIGDKSTIADVTWTTNDVTASILILAPEMLAHRQLPQPASEMARFACTNPETLAQLLFVLPLYTRMVYAMSDDSSGSPFADGAAPPPPEFPIASLSKSQTDLEQIRKTLYRCCLTVVRECLLSLELEPHCKGEHFTYCLELWAVLMNPFEKHMKMAPPQYAAQHFESFGFLTVDVLNMIVKSSFVHSMTEASARVLKKCFLLLSQDSVMALLAEINASQTSSRTVAESLVRHFVLNWAGGDGLVQLPNLHGDTTCSLAARAYVALERLDADGVAEGIRQEVKETHRLMESVFPRLTPFLSTWRASQPSTFWHTKPAASPTLQVARQLSENEKVRFFRGGRGRQPFFVTDLRLPTCNGRVPGGHHAALQTSMRNEIPAVLWFSRFLDAVIAKGQESYYTSSIPRCDRGHLMWLTYSKHYACMHHPRESAIWECAICEAVYGSCCRGLPCRADGERLVGCDYVSGEVQQCAVCGQVVPENCSLFSPESGKVTYYCPDCASRPFRPVSTRWIASYRTWAALLVLCVVYITVSLLR